MKHVGQTPGATSDPAAKETYLRSALAEIGLDLPDSTFTTLLGYLDAVLVANSRFNLTGVVSFEDGVWLHVVDSLLGLADVDSAPPGRLVDIGSGAGFPGVPLVLATGRPGVLVESVGKKARFLEEATQDAGIPVEVWSGRAEDLSRECRGGFAVATVRAVAPLPSLVELASPLLAEGGWLVAYKGHPDETELARGDRAAAGCGMRRVHCTATQLLRPEPAARMLCAYERSGTASVRLPRRTGLAQRRPLF